MSLSLLIALIVVLVLPATQAFAYYPTETSLLTGKTNLNNENSGTKFTDGDINTHAVLGVNSGFVGYQIFDNPVYIDQAYIRFKYATAYLKFTFEDGTSIIKTQAGPSQEEDFFIPIPTDKKVIRFDIYGTHSGSQLYEVDLRAASSTDTPDPTEPQPEPQPVSNRAILSITMLTGLEKEYDLSMDEVNTFINWYDTKDAGSGPSKYAINKHDNNRGPFSKRTDYVIFNNILTFEVSEYSTVTTATYQ